MGKRHFDVNWIWRPFWCSLLYFLIKSYPTFMTWFRNQFSSIERCDFQTRCLLFVCYIDYCSWCVQHMIIHFRTIIEFFIRWFISWMLLSYHVPYQAHRADARKWETKKKYLSVLLLSKFIMYIHLMVVMWCFHHFQFYRHVTLKEKCRLSSPLLWVWGDSIDVKKKKKK